MSVLVGEIIQHKKWLCILSTKFYHFEGSCTHRVPSSSKEYCAPNKARLELTIHAVYLCIYPLHRRITHGSHWLDYQSSCLQEAQGHAVLAAPTLLTRSAMQFQANVAQQLRGHLLH